ncbi:MAG: RNA repair transcriptional activator RtcR [Verrucomicrobiales bacterium]
MITRKRVVLGFIGTNLDAAGSLSQPERWESWRPTVSLCQHPDFVVDRIELFTEKAHRALSKTITEDIRTTSPETEVHVHVLGIRDPWDFQDVYEGLFDFAAGYHFDPEREDYLVHITTGTHVAQICLFLLTESRRIPGQLLQSEPPRGRKGQTRSSKHPSPGKFTIIDLDLARYDRLATRFAAEHEQAQDFLKDGIATKSATFNLLIEKIETVALRSVEPILLMGPTGAGKSRLAARIFELRQQRCALNGNFVELNCATLRGDTAASMLFGHKRGAFTGAQNDRPGLLREADKGLLFLDEIGELGADEQAMLLRALEEKSFLPVGSDKPMHSDFQLIAGTNRDLRKSIGSGDFRDDLFARINLWTFDLPSLADRREDIAPNIEYELAERARTHGHTVTFNKEARDRFLTFAKKVDTPWLGNFRDLNAAVTRMSTLAPRGRIRVQEVEEEITRLQANWQRPDEANRANFMDCLNDLLTEQQISTIDPFDRPQLAYTISVIRESRTLSEAGRKLFAVSREKKTNRPNDADRLRKYLAKFDLSFESIR